jgi:drug/metabolite transporter (DMT)-like permease
VPLNSDRERSLALIALLVGALAIATAGVFVRLSETGPTATAFWRGALALPLLVAWAWLERRRRTCASSTLPAVASVRGDARFFWAGAFFAGNLALLHWSLLLTSIAASMLEANLAPVAVTLFAWAAWRERPKPRFLLALALAVTGMLLIVSPNLGTENRALLGDVLGLATACFYAGYIVTVTRLRSDHGTGIVMLVTTAVYTLLLLPVALTQTFIPHTFEGWGVLVGLAVIAQFLGQGLIVYALAHMPATFGSLALNLQPVAAAVCAWLWLGERLTAVQIAGAGVTLGAIMLARSATLRYSTPPQAMDVETPTLGLMVTRGANTLDVDCLPGEGRNGS